MQLGDSGVAAVVAAVMVVVVASATADVTALADWRASQSDAFPSECVVHAGRQQVCQHGAWLQQARPPWQCFLPVHAFCLIISAGMRAAGVLV